MPRNRPSQPSLSDNDRDHLSIGDMRGDAAAGGFDFWKFWHDWLDLALDMSPIDSANQMLLELGRADLSLRIKIEAPKKRNPGTGPGLTR